MTQCIVCGGIADKGWETCSSCDYEHYQQLDANYEEPNYVPCYYCKQPTPETSDIEELNICNGCLNREIASQNQYLNNK